VVIDRRSFVMLRTALRTDVHKEIAIPTRIHLAQGLLSSLLAVTLITGCSGNPRPKPKASMPAAHDPDDVADHEAMSRSRRVMPKRFPTSITRQVSEEHFELRRRGRKRVVRAHAQRQTAREGRQS